MSKIIIAIHGLGNKPPEDILKKWWEMAIFEGLKHIGHFRLFLKFEFVYWTDILHTDPLDPQIKDKDDPLYLDEPYTPAKIFKKSKPNKIRKKILDYLNNQLDKLFLKDDMTIHFEGVSDLIIHHYFRDLEIYFSSEIESNRLAKDVIQQKLVRILKKHRRKKILLIAHSMGSIIAYDVLTHVLPKSQIHTFVTIGSPLGMPIVISKIVTEQKKKLIKSKKVRTPENVTHYWYNFSDLEDKTAIDYDLAGDYDENSKHIKVIDKLVHNNYEYDGKENPHKSFGYLRAPEFSKVIYDFLYEDKPWLVKWIRNKWDYYLSKFTGSGSGVGNIL